MGRRNTGLRRSLAIIIALVMVLTSGVAPLTQFAGVAYAASQDKNNPTEVKDWAGLREAVKDGGYIKITQDLVAEGSSIDITKDVHIVGDNATIWRKDGDANFPVFNVKDGGLELGKGLTLTGLTGKCPDGEFKVVFHNGGEGDKAKQTDPEVMQVGDSIDKNPADIASDWAPETGLVFKGWKFKGPNGGDNDTSNNTPNTSTGNWKVPADKYGTMTLVAQWEKSVATAGEFKVVFHNGGEGDKAKQTDPEVMQVGESIDKNPADIASDWAPETGLVFKGWKFKGPNGGDNDTSNNTPNTSTGNWKVPADKHGTMTLVAQWEKPSAGGSGDLTYNDGQVFYLQNNSEVKMFPKDGASSTNNLVEVTAFIKDGGVYIRKPDGNDVQLNCWGGTVRLNNGGGYDKFPLVAETINGKTYLKEVSNNSNNGKYMSAQGSGLGGFDFSEKPDGHHWNSGSAPTPYKSIDPIAWKNAETSTSTEPYASITTPDFVVSAGSGGQGCEGDGGCKEYSTSDFSSGKTDAPRGFFVQVDQGTVTLAGATLENFNTSTNKDQTPKHVAPVVASGSTAKFIVQSGKIQYNIVGYVADDSKSTNGGNVIKKYIKGAAPNARRKNAPEPADGTKRRRNAPAGIDGGNPGSGITGTAGAVIYANGAKGEISGGSIGYNRADTGGIMVTDEGSFVEIKNGANINHNVGVQFGGGTTVEQGGSIYMSGGEIHDNVAWFGGGAVFATQNGIDWLLGEKTMSKSDRLDGNFTLDGGKIYGNNAFTRGGGFLVDSNGVAFLSGEIRDNTSRVLGGGAYVMGDHPDYSYTLYIASGQIYENEARGANRNEPTVTSTAMSKKLNSQSACGGEYNMFGSSMGNTSDDIADFQRINDGTGGGVWTCSYGSTVLDLDASKVYIHHNTADGSTGNMNDKRTKKNEVGGQDFHSDNGGDGTLLMINADSTQWLDENTGEMYTPGEVDAEIRNLKYDGPEGNKTTGIQIYHNASRRGGGLAADGTFVFGDKQDVARVTAELDISKVWDASIPVEDRKPVIIRVGVENNGKTAVVRDIELDGEEDLPTDEDPLHENIGSENEWTGGFNIPVTVDTEDGDLITVFYIEGPDGTKYDPSKKNDTDDFKGTDSLATALDGGDGKGFKLASDAKLTFTELVKNGDKYEETGEYQFTPGEIQVKDLDVTVKEVSRVNAQGVKEHVLNVSFAKVPLKAPLRNEAPSEEVPGPEKYINKVVHTSLPAFDEKFEYAVLAYVPKDATEVVLTDTLEEPLEFVNKTKETVLSGFYVLAENDSKGDGNGIVATTPRDKVSGNTLRVANGVKNGSRGGTELTLDGNTVTLKLKEQFLQGVVTADNDAIFKQEGKDRDYVWVMMTFDAQYNKDYYDLAKVKDNTKNGDSWLENADDKSGGAALTYVQNNAEVRQNDSTKKYIIKLGDKYYNSSDAKEWTDVTKDANYYVARWDGKGDPKFNKLEGSAILDVTGIAIPEEAGITANGFVKDATEEHSGTKNQAEYKLTRGNNSASEYKTNIVTVDAPTTKFEAEKKWKNANGSDTTWPEGVDSIEVDVIEINKATQAEKKVDTIVLKKGESKKQSKELPKLNNATYRLEEVTVDGYTTASEDMAAADLTEGSESGKVFTNTKDVEEKPEIEKYVNESVHKDITLDEVFTYDILAYVTNDADEVTITDTLVPYLDFATGANQWYVQDIGPDNNHKVTNNVANVKQNDDASVSYLSPDKMNGEYPKGLGNKATKNINNVKVDEKDTKQLHVFIKDATPYRGHWIKVRFTAKIKAGLTIDDLQKEGVYREVKGGNTLNDFDKDRAEPNKGNSPVKAGATHTGVPNDASYVINVNNEAKYNDRSNTVTVKPETTTVEVSKVWVLDGKELATDKWPQGATVEVKVIGKDDAVVATDTLTADKQRVTFNNLPKLEGVTYSVEEGTVTNAGIYEIGAVEKVKEGVFKITNTGTTPEEPEIEKYVNKKSDEGTAKDGGVHTDLAAFDEVYTYDIQAYIAKDATVAEVTDELQTVLQFVGEASSVKVVVKEGEADGKAPKLSKEGKAPEDSYIVDADAWKSGKLVLTLGDAEDTEVLKSAGKWLQITFDAKIKDDYRSIQKLKDAGAKVWEKIETNEPIDDATVDGDNHSGATTNAHEGIVNDSSYRMKKAGVDVENTWTYEDKSNTVTVQPKTTKVEVSKKWIVDGADAKWPEGAEVEVKVIGKDDAVVATGKLTADKQSVTFSELPCLEDVTYIVKEGEVTNPQGTATGFAFGAAQETEEGKFVITNTKGEKPEIEKYVNKKSDEGTAKDGGVHTDLAAFDEVYTYDIQAYITNDAKYVEVTDELKKVLQFVGDASSVKVVVKEGEGDDGMTAPKLSKEGAALEDSYAVDENAWAAGKLVLTLGDAEGTEVLKSAGKWLQITFDAKIKDKYHTIDAIKGKDGAWTTVKANAPIDDATVDALADSVEADKSKVNNHAGIVNDASYTINVGVENAHKYRDSSNKVTVKPSVTKLEVSKVWVLDGKELAADKWPQGATVEVKVIGKDDAEVATDTLTADKQRVTFNNLPKLEGVTYSVEEGTVTNAGIYEIGAVEKVKEGVFKITNTGTTPEKPEIEKYVNKKDATPEQRDGTVHTDLSAFDEVYTYDIQAYVTKDAKYVVVTDQLVDVLELVNSDNIKIVVKDGAGEDGKTAPALSSTAGVSDVKSQCSADLGTGKANKLVFTFGSDANDAEVLDFAGKWIQITFDAKIKDTYRSIEALKKKGVNVWTEITTEKNKPVEDADTTTEFSGATADSHTGIINDSSYTINKKAGVIIGNQWQYEDKSNTVTVQPKTTKVEVSKEWKTGSNIDEWPDGAEVEVILTQTKNGQTTPVDGKTDKLTANKTTVTFDDLAILDGVTYGVAEGTVTNAGQYAIGDVEETSDGVFKITNKKEQPEIEKYVNKKSDNGTAKDGGVHTDLAAFDEVYTYDIQAYIANDATVAEVTDELQTVLQFVGEASSVKVVVKEGEADGKAPKLSKEGATPEDKYTVDENAWAAGKLVLTLGDAEDTEVLKSAGKWLQITFDAKIKDDYRSIQELKDAGAKVWEKIETNEPIDDATVDGDNHSGATTNAHEGIVNDSSYKMKKAGVDVGNTWTYKDASNKVTVQPKTVVLEAEKQWQDIAGEEMSWPDEVEEVVINIINTKNNNKVVDTIVLNSLETKKSKELPKLVGVEYALEEVSVPGYLTTTEDGKLFVNKKNTILIPVIKTWDDNADFDGRRTISVVMNLLQDGEIFRSLTITNAAADSANPDVWYGAFTDVPYMDEAGHVYEYTVEEVPVAYYLTEYSGSIDTEFKVTNIHRPWFPEIPETPGEEASFVIKKETTGAAETDKVYNVEISLTFPPEYVAEGEEATYTYTMELKPGEEYTVDKLPAKTQVTIKETSESSKGYEVSYLLNGKDCKTVSFEAETSVVNRVVVINYKAPEKPEKPDKPKEETPKTGDESNMMMWISLAGLAGATTVVMATRRRRNYK